ncbi:PepSY domain-containing protein [Halalkalibacter okhensis]|uniref:PepSY domain-containing protein n=1 Tax=Halalkalibacter okhensis TaxID=333138 RepID=A0A0B0IFW3_9BACI|nr:PepSY domain-containing protein [Halalkalibacter okhensis]KHF40195.1 hypothetical protein LQ50_10645 [Halalkalibacter okhensis]
MTKTWISRFLIGFAIVIAMIVAISFLQPAQATLGEDEIREGIIEQYGGSIHSFNKAEQFGQSVYKIELVNDGRLYEVIVDPYNGDILSLVLQSGNIEYEETDLEEITEKTLLTQREIKEVIDFELDDDVVILEVEQQILDGVAVYAVEVRQQNGTGEVVLNAYSGEVLFYALEDEAIEHPNQEQQLIGEEEAIRIALSHIDGTVDDVDLEEENGKLIYEIEMELKDEDVEVDVIIDAITGELITIIWED